MYEYQKNTSNQSGGNIAKVTVEEMFDDEGRLISRTTVTEYHRPVVTPYQPWTVNTGQIVTDVIGSTSINYGAIQDGIAEVLKDLNSKRSAE